MVAGAFSALRGGCLSKAPVFLFVAGITLNLLLALLPAPDIVQTIGAAARNAGNMGMGYFLRFRDSRAKN
jgi:hypothetical protein